MQKNLELIFGRCAFPASLVQLNLVVEQRVSNLITEIPNVECSMISYDD
jgi:hypothetical protein